MEGENKIHIDDEDDDNDANDDTANDHNDADDNDDADDDANDDTANDHNDANDDDDDDADDDEVGRLVKGCIRASPHRISPAAPNSINFTSLSSSSSSS